MNALLQAFSNAAPVWHQALAQVSWHHGLVTASYLGAAWLCFMNAYLASAAQEPRGGWHASVTILCLLAANTVLRADLWLAHVLRAMAQLQGWYGQRRPLQYAMLALLLLMLVVAGHWSRRARVGADRLSRSATLSLGLLLVLAAMRAVSAHHSDAVLNLRVLGLSLGRWLEFGAIGLVALSARRGLVRR